MDQPVAKSMGLPPDFGRLGPAFRQLTEIIAKLRSPEGCPWDREQTLETIKPYTLEETYELLEAIDSQDDGAIVEELGDVLLQVVLDSQIAADEQRFTLTDVVDCLARKMVARHPHVFGEGVAHTASDVRRSWEKIKEKEKQRDSLLDGLPAALPALARASRLSDKAARVGFDFPQREMLFDKLREELDELQQELGGETVPASADAPPTADPVYDIARQERIEAELGDVLFVIANIARRWHINPEEALRRSNSKFEARFREMERRVRGDGHSLGEMTMVELEAYYQAAKQAINAANPRPEPLSAAELASDSPRA